MVVGLHCLFLDVLDLLKEAHSFFDGVGADGEGFGAGIDDESDGVVDGGDSLGDFEVDPAVHLVLGGAEHEGLVVDLEVVLGPAGEKAFPDFKSALHYSITYSLNI